MSNETWKLEKDLCRCCHSEGSFKNLSETSDEGQEVYSDMLQFALDINVLPVAGMLCCVTYTICEQCSDRLRDAVSFKRQVLQCEERFRDMYDKDGIKVLTTGDLKVKEEVPEEYPEVDGKPDLPTMDGDDSDDFPLNDLNSEEIKQEDPKKSKPKKAKQKKKLGRPKKTDAGNGEKKVSTVSPEDMSDFTIIEEGNKKKYSCNKCGSVLSTMDSIRVHILARHFNIMKHECPLCDAKFKHRGTKTQHLATKHGMEEIKVGGSKVMREAEKCICEICKKVFASKGVLTKHIPTHKLVNCPECSVVCTKLDMVTHRSEVHGAPIPTCGVCGYKNRKKGRVVIHQRKVHLKEKNLPCPHCDARFFDNKQLKRHLVRHNPVKIFECPHCMKKFARLNTLRQHERIHTGDKRKVCPICDERFVQKASLNYHMTKHHPQAC
ncbi:zinc finger protein 768-like isoform X1 [Galleria mellonella]|uniref:Zinc finger protein 768-like isoform X1 n=1 Tax=Galleria mellonella TaxID=7137 RepID=A0ABM3N166_GALME|nr:zinc finger protein 768-like isoform X1 [Galleria mellonella]